MAGYLGLILCLYLCFWRTHGQILQAPTDPETGYLDLTTYPLPANFGGVFTYPTSVTQIYDEGVPMTIAWNTTYQHISLYVAYVRNISLAAPVDGAGNSQRQLQSESGSHRTTLRAFFRSSTNECLANTPSDSSDSFSWVASCAPDCNVPYQLHIVNSHGTSQEVTQEGFWSDYFWIRASSRPETETSTATSATWTSTASSASSTTSNTSTTTSTTSTTTASSTPSATSTQAPPLPIATTSETESPSPRPAATESSGLSTGVTVGISIAAVAIALCAIGIGVFYCLMKKNRGEKVSRDPHASYEGDTKSLPIYYAMTPQKLAELDTIQPMNQIPTELAATQSPTELGTTRWR
jgi:hypothetical protein